MNCEHKERIYSHIYLTYIILILNYITGIITQAIIAAFGSNYTLCLVLKYFKDDPIVSSGWKSLNVTVFGSANASDDISISTIEAGLIYFR
jgi:hypothetical protein